MNKNLKQQIYLVSFGIILFVTQYIENQFIYPHVVGTSVGLSPLWTLIAVVIGGEMLGLFGMIFFIPLMAVIYHLLSEYINNKLYHREIQTTHEDDEKCDSE